MRINIRPDIGARIAGPLINALARSWRIETEGEDRWRALHTAGQAHILMCWHEALLPLLWRHRHQGIVIVVSEARDGAYLSEFAHRIGYRAVKGSSTRGGIRALLGAIRELQSGNVVAFTPDGPQGPRRELKPGVIAAAQRGGVVILPLHAAAGHAWRLRSWDRFMIPKPYARVRISYGEPFAVGAGPLEFQRGVERASAALDHLARADGCQDGEVIDIEPSDGSGPAAGSMPA
jgi:lysophospholipid acyltransferase (LPLAT)-like uncharacterized protein